MVPRFETTSAAVYGLLVLAQRESCTTRQENVSDASDVEGTHTRTFHHCSTCATSAWNALRSLAIVVV